MGKPTGFMDFERIDPLAIAPKERIGNYREFHMEVDREERRKQGARCMACGVPFCQAGMEIGGMVSGCPLHNLVPEWNELLYQGNDRQAYERLARTNSFPEFTSRVCPALCEAACTCNLNGKPVTTKANEYAIIENAFENGWIIPNASNVKTGKRIAIVGSGPSGLAAAAQLIKRGHEVVVYERSDRVGGLLMYGIPNMKLEKWVIDRRVDLLKQEGVQFKTGVDVGKDISAKQLKKEYDAVILTCGASKPRDITAKGREKVVSSFENSNGVFFAVDYLKSVTKHLLDENEPVIQAKDKRVVIVGGGDTGNDCVASCIRQGAKNVIQLEMMGKLPESRADSNPWPEWPKVLKTDYGQEEAIAVYGQDPRVYETTIQEFVTNDKGKLTQIKTVNLVKTIDNSTGRIKMDVVPKSEKIIPVDIVLIAAGFLGAQEYVTKAFEVATDERLRVTSDDRFLTNQKGVFVAGDMRRGQSLVVWAIHEGRQVASYVDESLMGYTNLLR